jgi:hypothetical protein
MCRDMKSCEITDLSQGKFAITMKTSSTIYTQSVASSQLLELWCKHIQSFIQNERDNETGKLAIDVANLVVPASESLRVDSNEEESICLQVFIQEKSRLISLEDYLSARPPFVWTIYRFVEHRFWKGFVIFAICLNTGSQSALVPSLIVVWKCEISCAGSI